MKKITFDLPIYTYQIDFAGHVSNIVYIEWMEIGRLKLLDAVGLPVPKITKQGFIPILVHTEITYKRPLYLGETVRIELWLSEFRFASAHMEFRFYNPEGVLSATGYQKGLFVNPETMRPYRLLPEQRAVFEPYVLQESEANSADA